MAHRSARNASSQHRLQRIVDTFVNREELQHFSYLASWDEIEKNNYNLSVSTYVEGEDTREVIDIKLLNTQIEEIVRKEMELRTTINDIIAGIEEDV